MTTRLRYWFYRWASRRRFAGDIRGWARSYRTWACDQARIAMVSGDADVKAEYLAKIRTRAKAER